MDGGGYWGGGGAGSEEKSFRRKRFCAAMPNLSMEPPTGINNVQCAWLLSCFDFPAIFPSYAFIFKNLANSIHCQKISPFSEDRSRIHERTISLRFLGIILPVVFVYNVYITNQFKTTFAERGEGRVKSVSRGNCGLLSQLRPRIQPQGQGGGGGRMRGR